MNREDIVKLIQKSQLDEDAKRRLLNLIIEKGLTREVVDQIKETFDDAVIATLQQAGVDLTQTKEFQAAEAEFSAEAQKAKSELDTQMAQIDKEMVKVQTDTSKQLDDLQAQIVKNSIA